MNHSTKKEMLIMCADFVRYTFKPTFSFVLLVCAYGVLAIMTIKLYRFQPLQAVSIFFGFTGLLSMAMIANFIGWKRYKEHYYSVFKK